MRKKQNNNSHLLAVLSAFAVWCFAVSLVSCSSDERGAPPSDGGAAPLRFTLSFDGYEDTRGVVSNEMDESVGLFAYLYESDWDAYATNPNFMYNEEMQFTGSQWLTVGVFDQPAAGYLMRFYTYYPFDLPEETLSLSSPEQIGAPDFTYTVPQELSEQVDLMAGKSESDISSQDLRTAGAINIKMSHLLTAVKFQVGKCTENGYIVKIALKHVLARNSYQLSETEEYVEDPDNPGTFLTDPVTGNILREYHIDGWTYKDYSDYPDDFSDFSAEMNRRVVLTKTKTEGGQTVIVPQPVVDDKNAFLMLPQKLPEDAMLEVTFNCGGSDHVLTASLGDKEWVQGKKVTYTLDITSLTRLTIRSQITPWNQHETIDGVATDGVTILMGTELDDWIQHVTLMNSDDPRETNP